MNSGHAVIAFVGDIFLGSGGIELSEDVADIFTKVDYAVANLESPITTCQPIDSAKILLCSQCGCEEKLRQWGINLVTLANNHICDHGADGLQETIDRLDEIGISHIGAGCNLSEATKAKIVEIESVRLGFLSCTWEGTQAIYATENEYGCVPLEEVLICSQIRELKTQVDHVIVMPHWGYCDFPYPTDFDVMLGEKFFDAGASAVVGHHSHILHGFRQRNDGKFIAYSLGDFLFGDYEHAGRVVKSKGKYSRGAVLEIVLNSSEIVSFQWHFTRMENCLVKLEETQLRGKKFQERCQPLADIDAYSVFWKRQVKKRIFKRCLFWINPANWRYLKLATLQSMKIMLAELLGMKHS
jgi:hypothetical protein